MKDHNRADVAGFINDQVKKWCVLRASGGHIEAAYLILEKRHTDSETRDTDLSFGHL